MIGLDPERWTFQPKPHLAVDTEARHLRAHEPGNLFMIQWAGADYEDFCESDDPDGVVRFLRAVAEVPRITMANAGYDTHVLRSCGVIDFLASGHEIMDVQTLARVTMPERGFKGYKLKPLSVDLLGVDADEEERHLKELMASIGLTTLKKEGAHYLLWQAYPREMEAYGMNDVRITYDVFELLAGHATVQDLAVFQFETAVQRELLIAEQHGVLVDKVALAKLRIKVEARIVAAERGLTAEYEQSVRAFFRNDFGFNELRDILEGPPNAKGKRTGGLVGTAKARAVRGLELVNLWSLRGHEEFAERVAQMCLGEDGNPANQTALRCALLGAGVPLYRTTDKSGEFATNKDALSEFADDYPIIGQLFEWRAAKKMLQTYVEALERANPRVHANFLSCEARTSRMSCIAEGGLVDAPRNLLLHPRGIPIEDIRVGQFVYSHGDDGVPRPQRVLAKTFMGDKKVLRLVWRACGSKSYLGELVATPDHRVRLEDGSYRRMDELRPDDRLAYIGRSMDAEGRAQIRWGSDRQAMEHQHLCPDAEVVHHDNGIKADNRVENLVSTTATDHGRLHTDLRVAERPRTACPYTVEQLSDMVAGGIRKAMDTYGHSYAVWKRWTAQRGIEIPDHRRRNPANNHRVVMVMSDGEMRPTWDLTIENTPCFVVNEIGVHNCRSPNMQNLPRGSGARDCIIPAPGNALVVLDFDSIEVRILAHYLSKGAKRTELRDAVEAGLDAHTRTAAQVFGHRPHNQGGPPPGVPALEWYAKGAGGDPERTVTKNTVFASMYGVGVAKLSRMIGKDKEEGRRIKNAVLGAIDGYWDLIDALKLKMRVARHLKTILGRRLDVPQGKTHVYLNSIVQGSAAEALKLGLLAAAPLLREVGYQVILVVHDELVAEGPADRAEEAVDICREAMQTVSDYFDCKMKATGSYSTESYAHAK